MQKIQSEKPYPERIVVVGTSGSGKTTLARRLSKLFSLSFHDLDSLYWLPQWQKADKAQFKKDVETLAKQSQWVLCGNQSRLRHLIWPRAQVIIWLDMPLLTCLYRALKRTLILCCTKKPHCNGNYESLSRLFGKDSILLWVIKTFSKRRKAFAPHFSDPFDESLKRIKKRRANNLSEKSPSFHKNEPVMIRVRNNKELLKLLAAASSLDFKSQIGDSS